MRAVLAALAAAVVLVPVTGMSQSSTPTVTQPLPPTPGIQVEVLSLPTRVTGEYAEMLRKLGQASEPLMALLFYPEAGINQFSPAILFHHGGLGGHPARQVGAPRFAAERLAARGYTVLSIMSRHSRHYRTVPFEEAALDIRTGLDFLQARGMENLILAGHSLGSIRITHYMTATEDPRVKAMVHFAPTADMHGPGSPVSIADYEQKVAAAARASAAGRGRADRGADPGREKGLEPDPWVHVGAGYIQTPEAFLSFWGPTARTRNSDWFPHLKVPLLLLSGTNDSVVPAGRLEQLAALATASPRVDYRWYEGANHFFEGARDQSVVDMAEWLEELGLGVQRRVRTELVDTRMGNGRHLPGVLYHPEGADPSRPAFLLLHGWTGDILHSSNHWLGWRLARQGFTVLAPEIRVSGAPGIQKSGLAEVAEDLGKWMDYLESRGYDQVIMEGHSAGGIWISNYMSVSQDPRVLGMVYLAPTRDMPTWVRDGMGDQRYAEVVAEAQAAVDRGEGRDHLINHKYYAPAQERFGPIRADALQVAEAWLEYWGPESRAMHTERVAEFDRPSLTIAGSQDGLMSERFVNAFTRAHRGDAKLLWYEGGSHGLREAKERVTADIVAWTNATFPE